MKIEDIEKACKLNKELKEINEILEAELDKVGCPSSFVLMLYHNNERYNLTPPTYTRSKNSNIGHHL